MVTIERIKIVRVKTPCKNYLLYLIIKLRYFMFTKENVI